MTNSRDKGARVEREAAEWFRDHLGTECERTAQRTGKGGTADLRLPDGCNLHVEVKGGAAWNVYAALEQARRDHVPSSVPMMWAKRDYKEPIVACYARDLVRLAREIARLCAEQP